MTIDDVRTFWTNLGFEFQNDGNVIAAIWNGNGFMVRANNDDWADAHNHLIYIYLMKGREALAKNGRTNY